MELNEYASKAMQTAIYPGAGTPMGLAYVALKMNGEAGEFAEHLGKAMRDESYGQPAILHHNGNTSPSSFDIIHPSRHALLVKEIGDVLWYLAAACRELNVTLEQAAQINLDKLADRNTRNKISGSGDER